MRFADTVADSDYADTASESGQARGLPEGGGLRGHSAKRKRRSRSSSILASRKKRKEDAKDELAGAGTDLQQIRIDEAADYYFKALRSIKQLACKDIAKAWIRRCHLKKQTTHPYNGGKSDTARSQAEYGYLGHLTRPDYWPSDEGWGLHSGLGVRHREPDHLTRAGLATNQRILILMLTFHLERIKLIPHLLTSQYKGFKDGNFSLENLKEATENIHLKQDNGKNWTPASVERLEEIYRVRAKEMEYERKEIGDRHPSWWQPLNCANIASDGDTLVTVQMFKRRDNPRGPPKSTVKAAKPSSKHSEQGPEQKSPRVCNTPAANKCFDLEMENEGIDFFEGFEPSIHTDTSSSTEEVTPDACCSGTTLDRARRTQHGLSSSHSSSAQENWTMQSANLRQTSNISAHPTPDGYVVTRGEPQRSLQLREHRFVPSSMQTFPSQEARHHNDYRPTASQRAASQNITLTRSPPARPVAPKEEKFRYLGFAASSSGTAGAFPENDEYPSWQIQDRWTPQAASLAYTAAAGSSASPLPSTNTSFSTSYGDARLPSGPQLDTWNQIPSRPYYQSFDADPQQHFGMQTVSDTQYDFQQFYSTHTPSGGIPDLANQSLYSTDFHPHNPSLGPEHYYLGPSSKDHRQL